MELNEHVEQTWLKLKDFQRATVEYTLHQFFNQGRNKMLIADEVGLGKTIVSRGVVARMFERHQTERPGKEFTVIYICSNQAIAKQNIEKLNFFQGSDARNVVDYSRDDDRITALSYEPKMLDRAFPLRIKAFTPGTSFDENTASGRSDERLLLLRLISVYNELEPYQNALYWLFKGNRRISIQSWDRLVQESRRFDSGEFTPEAWRFRRIRESIRVDFKRQLEEEVSPSRLPNCFQNLKSSPKTWLEVIQGLCENGIDEHSYYQRIEHKEILQALRFLLADCCSQYLDAELFVLDEFQRYSKLLNSQSQDSPSMELARQVLNKVDSKVLMLSATPFKAYSNDFDLLQGESHFQEFKKLLKYLLQDYSDDFWIQFERDRKLFFNGLRHLNSQSNWEEVVSWKAKIESIYRSCMTRTERLIASDGESQDQKDGMIKSKEISLEFQTEDVADFILFDRIVEYLNSTHGAQLAIPLEYVKSCPFPLSFINQYAHKKKLEKHVDLSNPKSELSQLIFKSKNGWLDLKKVAQYRPIFPGKTDDAIPNPKLRLLLQETIENDGWKYLWIPPSLAYYKPKGPFQNSAGYSKTLLFSAWKMVPRMVATVLSYEIERKTIGKLNKKENVQYFDKNRYPYPLLTFKLNQDNGTPQGMNNYILTYPSQYLSSVFDPQECLNSGKSLDKIKKSLRSKIKTRLLELNILELGEEGQSDWQKWNWFAVLFLDHFENRSAGLDDWLKLGHSSSVEFADDRGERKNRERAKESHFQWVRNGVLGFDWPQLPKLNEKALEKLCSHLADLCLGSPAIAALRSCKKIFGTESKYFKEAYTVGHGVVSFFNKPESIAVVQLTDQESMDYYRAVLNYSIDGNLQSMLDEYAYMMRDSNSVVSAYEWAETIVNVLSIRPSLLEVGSIAELRMKNDEQKKKFDNRMRSHFAADFGQQKASTDGNRQVNLREAFNSPFRPFVLASTSIGQEGLDFHFYSKKIVHWNLPSNPIDFEQREGRIHRFKGHVIRLNIAKRFKDQLLINSNDNVWNRLFELANKMERNNDLIPNWHVPAIGEDDVIKIDRIVPLYPFSRDIEKYENLLTVLAYYRLTFGQPRQEELVHAIASSDIADYGAEKFKSLLIDLAPIHFWK